MQNLARLQDLVKLYNKLDLRAFKFGRRASGQLSLKPLKVPSSRTNCERGVPFLSDTVCCNKLSDGRSDCWWAISRSHIQEESKLYTLPLL